MLTATSNMLSKRTLFLGFALLVILPFDTAHAKAKETVLYAFCSKQGCPDGALPHAGVIADKDGNLYGTTVGGGPLNEGTVFELAAAETEQVLYTFCQQQNCADGAQPLGGLLTDDAGNLYGTTQFGGGAACRCGTVFRLAPDGTETVLYSFAGGDDGAWPQAGLIADGQGNLYGTTSTGGGVGCTGHACGTVFKLTPYGTETVLHAFGVGADGANPLAGLIADSSGNLYGTTSAGGGTGCSGNIGCGVVFKVAPEGAETVLYAFSGGNDGGYPTGGLILDNASNLYGTTGEGGGGCSGSGCGVVFKLTPEGAETVLHSFQGGSDGAAPAASLLADSKGNLYGTTELGGPANAGTIFKLATKGDETVLYSFTGGSDGDFPSANLLADRQGNLYSTTVEGGHTSCGDECGTVFKITMPTATNIRSFPTETKRQIRAAHERQNRVR